MKKIVFILLFHVLSAHIPSAFSEFAEKIPPCRVLYDTQKREALRFLAGFEIDFTRYRWTEIKIRILEYDPLWRARHDGNDPISKDLRARAQEEESRLLKELAGLDQESTTLSNRMLKKFKEFQSVHQKFSTCCQDPEVQACIEKSFEPAYDKMQEGMAYFERIFEHEREYRKEVGLTIGGREGLYPEDTVESEVQHRPYFARYEIERRQARFEQDVWMIEFFQHLRKMLSASFSGDLCCLRCGKTNWEQKRESFFHGS